MLKATPIPSTIFNVVFFWKQHDTGIYGRRQEMLAKHMLASGRVEKLLHIEPPVYLTDLIGQWRQSKSDSLSHHALVLRNTLRRLFPRDLSDGFIAFTPLMISPRRPRSRLARNVDRVWANLLIRFMLHRCDFASNPTILWVCPSHQFIEQLLEVVPHALCCADCIDDNRAWFPEGSPRYQDVDANYRRVLGHAHLAFAVTKALANSLEKYNSNMYSLPNAVENQATLRAYSACDDARWPWPGPTLGYVGNLSSRIDSSLLNDVARYRPDWNIALIGSAHASDDHLLSLRAVPNIHFLGPIPYPKVISYISRFDVAIIPHLDNAISRSMDPLKLYLYLALGVPVVSTRFSGATAFEKLITTTSDARSFVAAVEDRLTAGPDTSPYSAQTIQNFLRENVWEERTKQVFTRIDELLKQGDASP